MVGVWRHGGEWGRKNPSEFDASADRDWSDANCLLHVAKYGFFVLC